jgi:hypothetical protein
VFVDTLPDNQLKKFMPPRSIPATNIAGMVLKLATPVTLKSIGYVFYAADDRQL